MNLGTIVLFWLTQKSQGKETLRYELDQDLNRRGRNTGVGQRGASRSVRLWMLWSCQVLWLCLDLPAIVLQTRDHSALLPERSHVSACLLDADRPLLQAELLRLGFVWLLQEELRRSKWQCLWC